MKFTSGKWGLATVFFVLLMCFIFSFLLVLDIENAQNYFWIFEILNIVLLMIVLLVVGQVRSLLIDFKPYFIIGALASAYWTIIQLLNQFTDLELGRFMIDPSSMTVAGLLIWFVADHYLKKEKKKLK